MQVTSLSLPGVKLIVPKRFEDGRGFFSEIYNDARFLDAGIPDVFVQDNLSFSKKVGTIRGLHFQIPPFSQAKLVRVERGRIVDVVVDLRPSSPTYREHVSVELSSKIGEQIYVPVGCAHGFCTLEPDTEVIYKVSTLYSPQFEGGVLWCDSDLNIKWPVGMDDVTVSEKDSKLPPLRELGTIF